MSTRKKSFTRIEMIDALLDMDRQIIDGSDIFKQAADRTLIVIGRAAPGIDEGTDTPVVVALTLDEHELLSIH